MFTGLVERTGRVVSLSAPADGQGGMTLLVVDAGKGFATNPGDSVAVNGCCLTLTSEKSQLLRFDVSRETLARTSLGTLRGATDVNLERALKLGDRLGGHLVSGHVDGVAHVVKVAKNAEGWELGLELGLELSRYVIVKGSICLDGISLTVNALEDRAHASVVGVTLIPTTVNVTSFKSLVEGQRVNVEVDQIAKFVERLAGVYQG